MDGSPLFLPRGPAQSCITTPATPRTWRPNKEYGRRTCSHTASSTVSFPNVPMRRTNPIDSAFASVPRSAANWRHCAMPTPYDDLSTAHNDSIGSVNTVPSWRSPANDGDQRPAIARRLLPHQGRADSARPVDFSVGLAASRVLPRNGLRDLLSQCTISTG